MSTKRLVVGVTGASGSIYAQRFLVRAAELYDEIHLVLSKQAPQVARTELFRDQSQPFSIEAWLGGNYTNIHLADDKNYYSPPASGSYKHDGMVIIPCSMGTAGRIAHGISDSLLSRAADVCLKERRPLIIVPRETPMNTIMLRNLATLSEVGATVVPACPAWYHRPQTLEELADTVVDRVFNLLGVDSKAKEWMVE